MANKWLKLMVNNTQQGQMQSGFTLVELMITMLILALILNYAVPAMGAFVERNRLKAAAEEVFSQIHYARTESIKQSTALSMVFSANGTDTWSFGLGPTNSAPYIAPCDTSETDASQADACVINVGGTNVFKVTINNSGDANFNNIKMALTNSSGTTINPYRIDFDQVRGTATSGRIILTSESGWIIRNEISPLGHVRVCSPAGNNEISGYPAC